MDRLLRNNGFAKFLALCIAIALWVVVISDDQPSQGIRTQTGVERVYPVRLEAVGLPKGLAIRDLPDTVNIRVRGAVDPSATGNGKIRAVVDLSGRHAGEGVVDVRARVSKGVGVLSVEPARVPVILEELRVKVVRIRVGTFGTVSKGHLMSSVSVSPATVRIEGPLSRVDRVTDVLATADVSGDRGITFHKTPIYPMDASGSPVAGVSAHPPACRVKVVADGETKGMRNPEGQPAE